MRRLRDVLILVFYAALVVAFLAPIAAPDELIPLDGVRVCQAGHRYEPLRLEGPRWVGFCYEGKSAEKLKAICGILRCDREGLPSLDEMVELEGLAYPWLYEEWLVPFHRPFLRPWNTVNPFLPSESYHHGGHHEAHR